MLSESPEQMPEEGIKEERHIAAIDLGSNSFHMVIAKTSHGELRVLEKLGEKVQLAAGINEKGHLSAESQERALACLERFQQRIGHFNAKDVQIVGTNALRAAKNRKELIRKAEKILNFPIEVISGREEARLIYLGVAHTMADDGGKRLVIDIGGGSTELIVGERFETYALESLHMGCVSYRDRYFANTKITKSDFDKAVLQASRELLNISRRYKSLGWNGAVGASGTIKAISGVLLEQGMTDGTITFPALKELRKKVLEIKHVDKLAELGMKADRVSVFASGLAILYACFKELDIESVQLTQGALREGLLYDIVGRIEHEDVRNRTISSLQQRYHIDTQQCALVEETVEHAFEQVADDWDLRDSKALQLLTWASQVYELGTVISHTQHHKHGAYMIEFSDLPGFTDLVKKQLATIVRLHRRRFANSVMDDLGEDEQQFLTRLCILFRIAIILTSSRVSAETAYTLKVLKNKGEGTKLSLEMGENWLSEHPLTNANLEYETEQLEKLGVVLKVS